MLEISRLQDKIASLQRMSAVFLTHTHSGHVDRDVREREEMRGKWGRKMKKYSRINPGLIEMNRVRQSGGSVNLSMHTHKAPSGAQKIQMKARAVSDNDPSSCHKARRCDQGQNTKRASGLCGSTYTLRGGSQLWEKQ